MPDGLPGPGLRSESQRGGEREERRQGHPRSCWPCKQWAVGARAGGGLSSQPERERGTVSTAPPLPSHPRSSLPAALSPCLLSPPSTSVATPTPPQPPPCAILGKQGPLIISRVTAQWPSPSQSIISDISACGRTPWMDAFLAQAQTSGNATATQT